MEAVHYNTSKDGQQSYLECLTTHTKERQISRGPNSFSQGKVTYARPLLTLANGFYPNASLHFRLHAFRRRSFNSNPGHCDTVHQKVLPGSFKITVHYDTSLACLPPTQLSAAPSINSASIDWIDGGGHNWETQLAAAGAPLGAGQVNAVAAHPHSLTGLKPGSEYQIRVREKCGPSSYSAWSQALIFRTPCATLPAPWKEDFENSQWPTGSNLLSIQPISPCYERPPTDSVTFVPFASGQLFTNRALNDHTSGSGKFIDTLYKYYPNSPVKAQIAAPQIATPKIDLQPLTVPWLRFWYFMPGSYSHQLEVHISTDSGLTYRPLWSISGAHPPSASGPWQKAVVDLSPYANQKIRLRFAGSAPKGEYISISLDDLSIEEKPSCAKPRDFELQSIWHDAACLKWQKNSAGSSVVKIGPPGFNLANGQNFTTLDDSICLPNLLPLTAYQVYIRDSCGANDVSPWVGPLEFTTLCFPQNLPYSEDFSSPDFKYEYQANAGGVDTCWRRPAPLQYDWLKGGFTYFSGPAEDYTTGTSGNFLSAFVHRFGSQPIVDTLSDVFTPLLNFSGTPNPEAIFWYHLYGADIHSLEMWVQTDDGHLHKEWSLTGQQQTSQLADWRKAVINLSHYGNDTLRLLFRARRAPGKEATVAIDDLSIKAGSGFHCLEIYDPMVDFTNVFSAQLSWTTIDQPSSYREFKYGLPGFTLATASSQFLFKDSVQLGGLVAATEYEFYVRGNCGSGSVSAWRGPIAFRTQCAPLVAPYFENFDGNSFAPPPNNRGPLHFCWRRNDGPNHFWDAGPKNFNSAAGPASDHTPGVGGHYILAENTNAIAPDSIAEIRSPWIDMANLSQPQLSF